VNTECVFTGINGYVYGNLPGLSMCQGNKIHWHLFGLGNEVNIWLLSWLLPITKIKQLINYVITFKVIQNQ